MTKRGVVLGIKVVIVLGGELVLEIDIFVRGSVFIYEGCSEDFLYFFFSFLYCSDTCVLTL